MVSVTVTCCTRWMQPCLHAPVSSSTAVLSQGAWGCLVHPFQGKSQLYTTTASPVCPPGSQRWGWKRDRHPLQKEKSGNVQKWQGHDVKGTQGFHVGHLFAVISLLFRKIERPSCDLKPSSEMDGPNTCRGMRGAQGPPLRA